MMLPSLARLGLSAIVILSLTVLVSLPAAAQEESPAAAAPPAANNSQGQARTATGSADDSMEKCLARIPKDASAGQRMVAEQGCERDQRERRAFQAVPGR